MIQQFSLPSIKIFDEAFKLLSNKQKFQQQLKHGVTLVVENTFAQGLLNRLLCCDCTTTQAELLRKQQQYNRKAAKSYILQSSKQNETVFQLKPSSGKSLFGSWYDVSIFQQWEDYFYNYSIGMKTQPQQQPNSTSIHQPLATTQGFWYSKISIWFSNEQIKFIFNDKQQHEHIFTLLTTLKAFYTKLHPEAQSNSMALKYFLQLNSNGKFQLERRDLTSVMKQMNFGKQQAQSYLRGSSEYQQNGSLSIDEFMKLVSVTQCPESLYIIFQKYATSPYSSGTIYEKYSSKCMSRQQFKRFLKQVQFEQEKNELHSIVFSNIMKKQKKKTNQQQAESENLSFIDFCQHVLSSSKNSLIVLQQIDSSKPLPYYYVNSSHNTYLSGNQLTSKSSANIYYLNLVEGMRCVELDLHDGQDGPIIKHGFTFTAPINFHDAMKAIMKFCIENPSHTPIILSFQNHCSQKNKKSIAAALSKIPFQKFYVIPEKSDNSCKFPTLKQLMGKIIIQGTGIFSEIYPRIVKFDRKDQLNQNQIKITDLIYMQGLRQNIIFQLTKSEGFDDIKTKKKTFVEKIKELEQNKLNCQLVLQKFNSQIIKRNGGFSQQINKYYGLVAAAFNLKNSCWQMANIAENNLLKMIRGQMQPSAQDIYKYSWHSMIRIYPFGLRFGSSNYNPIPMLQCGCQLVSLNTQNVDVYFVCVQGIFQKNRHCGYALKTDVISQNTKKYRYKFVFMNCINIKQRKSAHSDENSVLQISFLGSQEDMKNNYKYVNYEDNPNSIDFNEPITVSKQFLCQNFQVKLAGLQQHTLKPSQIPQILIQTQVQSLPGVILTIANSQFAHFYLNIRHCGSVSIPLKDIRSGIRTVPIYCFEIGRKKAMGQLLMWVGIQQMKA